MVNFLDFFFTDFRTEKQKRRDRLVSFIFKLGVCVVLLGLIGIGILIAHYFKL